MFRGKYNCTKMASSTIQRFMKRPNKGTGEKSKSAAAMLSSVTENFTTHDLFTLVLILLTIIVVCLT